MNHQFNDSKYLEVIFKGLHEKYGVDFSLYRESTIKRRLARRMAATDSDNYLDYFYTLEKEPGEYENLLRTLTIKVSRFFRNQHLFQTLYDDIFPDIMNAKIINNDNTLRIWGAGCAFGEEIYSVTITLLEYLKKKRKSIDDYDISIFAFSRVCSGSSVGWTPPQTIGISSRIAFISFDNFKALEIHGPD